MKYTIEIPTLETLDTLVAIAHRKAQKWILDTVSTEMVKRATIGKENYTLTISDCPYNADQYDINEVQNTLRGMGIMTMHHPRRNEFVVDWSHKARFELQSWKDNNISWEFTTREENRKREIEMEKILKGLK